MLVPRAADSAPLDRLKLSWQIADKAFRLFEWIAICAATKAAADKTGSKILLIVFFVLMCVQGAVVWTCIDSFGSAARASQRIAVGLAGGLIAGTIYVLVFWTIYSAVFDLVDAALK